MRKLLKRLDMVMILIVVMQFVKTGKCHASVNAVDNMSELCKGNKTQKQSLHFPSKGPVIFLLISLSEV